MSDTLTEAPERVVTMSDSAMRRVAELIREEGNERLMLRVMVNGGGCSGFQYSFDLDEARNDDDRLFEHDGVKLVVDEVSLDLLAGSQIDYVEELIGAAFRIRNPNAVSSCGCGSSFAIG
ncbi:MAG: iron-sulfur cluster insertion protein ErpA [Acetobacterales bacterium]